MACRYKRIRLLGPVDVEPRPDAVRRNSLDAKVVVYVNCSLTKFIAHLYRPLANVNTYSLIGPIGAGKSSVSVLALS